MVNFYSMCPPPASTTVSKRDLNALTDLDTSAASTDMATDFGHKRGTGRMTGGSVGRLLRNPAAVMVLGVISSEATSCRHTSLSPSKRSTRRCTW
ncbi:Transposable element tcb2 transposase, partial [Caligus rogercresseyi]